MKLLWLTNIPSPYRASFFNELGKKCELTVLFERTCSAERDSSWQKFDVKTYNAVFLKGIKYGAAEAVCPSVVKYIKKNYDYVVVANYSDITGIFAISYLKMKKIPYAVSGDGAFPGNGKGIKEKLKKWLLKDAALYFSTCSFHDDYYLMYGADKNEIVRYPFTSIYRKDILSEPVEPAQKEEIKAKLGIKEEKVVLAVGQFIHRKGFDLLIRAMAGIPENTGCYIVGGEATEEYKNLVESLQLTNVHFVGFAEPKLRDQYYLAADLFVHPTREDIWGLVINEAMAKGLPVVTTNKCLAGMEIINDSLVGKIVPVEDADALREAVAQYLQTDKESNIAVLNRINDYSMEKMVEAHLKWLK